MKTYRDGEEIEWPGLASTARDILKSLPKGVLIRTRQRLSTGPQSGLMRLGENFDVVTHGWLLDPIYWPLTVTVED